MVRLVSVQIHNFKSVEDGTITVANDPKEVFSPSCSDIVGIYGQNGSGKTTVIELLSLFKNYVNGEPLTKDIGNYISIGANEASATFTLAISCENGKYLYNVEYSLSFMRQGGNGAFVSSERLVVSGRQDGKRLMKSTWFELAARSADDSSLPVPASHINILLNGKRANRENILIAVGISRKTRTSCLFSDTFRGLSHSSSNSVWQNVIGEIYKYTNNNLIIIPTSRIGVISIGNMIPIAFSHTDDILPFDDMSVGQDKPMVTNRLIYDSLNLALKSMSPVLNALIPGLEVCTKSYDPQLLRDGNVGVRYEVVSKRSDNIIPIRYESEGIKKIISVLNYLIWAYTDPSVCVAIDELDAGIFEVLLGDILHVIEETGKGQLIFTSHNLRPLEVLDKRDVVFATSNPKNRYIRMKGVKPTNNLRDRYIRAIALGGEEEELATNVRESLIRRAMSKAGSYVKTE